jgi:aspartyl protease family protein
MTPDAQPPRQAAEPTPSKAGRRQWILFTAVFLVMTGLLLGLSAMFAPADAKQRVMQTLYGLVWILVVSAWVAFTPQHRDRLKHAFIWACIVLVLVAGYSYRFELGAMRDRIVSTLVPEYGMQADDRSMTFSIADDGHFYVRARIGGVPVRFLVDTGASDIVIAPADAERLGYDLENLLFNRFYTTANGTVRGAAVVLKDFSIGSLRFERIGASVNEAPMNTSLLGMSFFNRLEGYEVTRQQLTLRWQAPSARD